MPEKKTEETTFVPHDATEAMVHATEVADEQDAPVKPPEGAPRLKHTKEAKEEFEAWRSNNYKVPEKD